MEVKAPFEKVISLLRFPMMVGIVIIHCNITLIDPSQGGHLTPIQPSEGIITFFSEVLCRIIVPMFFLISGYLFFYRKDGSRFGFYTNQWRKRINTLLVPYLLWNLITLLFVIFKCYGPLNFMFPRLTADPITLKECFEAFWKFRPLDVENATFYEPPSAPIDIPLWFVRDLLVMMLFTPVLYRLLKIKVVGAIITLSLIGMFLTGIWTPYSTGFSLTAVTFFVAGCWLSIHHIDPISAIEKTSSINWICAVSAALYAISAGFELDNVDNIAGIHFHAVSIVIGVVMLSTASAILNRHFKIYIPSTLVASSFFIYGFHYILLSVIKPAIGRYITLETNTRWLVCYFLCIIVTLVVSVSAYRLCRLISPKFTGWLTGGRN
ncbi:MAG: acyltransferase [Muribaculaceae bacterium]|nr:acyltransferase [Muribaculaceae bacterium]